MVTLSKTSIRIGLHRTLVRFVLVLSASTVGAATSAFEQPCTPGFEIERETAVISDHLSWSTANSFEQDTLVHTRFQTDTGYQARLKPIKDIQVGDEVLAWDELQAHDNAVLAQAGQAVQTLQAAYQQASLEAKLGAKSASSPINMGVSSYENKSNFSTLSSVKPAQRYEKVTDTISSFKEQTLLHISLDNGQTIQATAGHPFKTREGWRDAVLLKKGGQLLLGGEADAVQPTERYATITDIRQEVKTTTVFNLEVANLHTYFVGVIGLVVHNGIITRPGTANRASDRAAGNGAILNEPSLLKTETKSLGFNPSSFMCGGKGGRNSPLNPPRTQWHHPYDNLGAVELMTTGEHRETHAREGRVGGIGRSKGR